MAAPILPVTSVLPAMAPVKAAAITAAAGASPFASILNQAVQQVETFQTNAATSVNRFLSGEGEELHSVALAAQEADLSFQMFMQVRNKVVAAYQQIMQMQV
jgi:flagellar hook-basal body complex protein FliE